MPAKLNNLKKRIRTTVLPSIPKALMLENGQTPTIPTTVAERVYQLLKRDILHAILQPGEALNEKVLAAKYHSSRTPVREAIMRLQQEDLLRIVPNKGYFVGHLTMHDIDDLYELRPELEGFCAQLAALRWRDEAHLSELSRLARIQYREENRSSFEKFIAADTQFHVGIAQLTHNHLLARSVAQIRCYMERIMFASIDIRYYGEALARQHCEIVEAIKARDSVQARKLMETHIIGSKDQVLPLARRG